MLKFLSKRFGPKKHNLVNKQVELFIDQVGKQKYKIEKRKFFEHVVKELGLKPTTINYEYLKLSRSFGQLSFDEYVLYRLYDRNDLSFEEKSDFISDKLHWGIVEKTCDMAWQIVTEDKFLSYHFLTSLGFPTPETVAIIDDTARQYGKLPKLRTEEDLTAFLNANDVFPLFAKPNLGIGSFGCFRINGIDKSNILLEQDVARSASAVLADLVKGRPFLLQKLVLNHSEIAAFSPYLATVRMTNFLQDENVFTPFCVLKLPSSTNIADNYWRPGNILANIDPTSGIVERAVRGKGTDLEVIDIHPDSQLPLLGMQLPFWDQLKSLNGAVASCFSPIRFQSLDIAITNNGPVVIEINTGGAFDLPQLASGRGLLTPDVKKFLRDTGVMK